MTGERDVAGTTGRRAGANGSQSRVGANGSQSDAHPREIRTRTGSGSDRASVDEYGPFSVRVPSP
ncbi:hypothetical protein GCM10008995_22070 [Halobellus salinus]|uniref:Uncharacterized protein n=1 Tax=Halobellus salinus TaxID=931585 RepID=A0A830EC80_9EURY|nr:hypothetical protein GCM10008995_22070 [Halobellus salinus]